MLVKVVYLQVATPLHPLMPDEISEGKKTVEVENIDEIYNMFNTIIDIDFIGYVSEL